MQNVAVLLIVLWLKSLGRSLYGEENSRSNFLTLGKLTTVPKVWSLQVLKLVGKENTLRTGVLEWLELHSECLNCKNKVVEMHRECRNDVDSMSLQDLTPKVSY